MRWTGVGLLALATLACSPRTEQGASRAAALHDIASTHAFDAALAEAAPFAKAGALFRATPRAGLDISVPEKARGITRLVKQGEPDRWIELRARDVRDEPAIVSGNALVFPSALEHGDIVVVASGGAFEELRVVRAGREHVARYEVSTGPGIADLRVREGRVEAIDETGRVAIGTAPAFLVDRNGARREVVAKVSRESTQTWSVAFDASLEGLAFPVVIDPVWSTVAMMKTPRLYHGAVTLADGKVLVFSGQTTGGAATSTAERYDPVANTWTDVGDLPTPIDTPNAILLTSGKVLATFEAKVAIYDPASATWTSGTSPLGGYPHAPVLLDDGRVVGFQSGGPNRAMSWSESTGAWTLHSGPAVSGLVQFSSAKLADGRVLVVGGVDQFGKMHTTAQIYNPTADTWSTTGSLLERRSRARLARLPSGKVLAVGGEGLAGDLSTSEIYDPATGTWVAGPPLPTVPAAVPSVTPLSGGSVLIIADGIARTWVEGFPSFLPMGSQPSGAPLLERVVPLPNGALVTGGFNSAAMRDVSRLVPLALGAACSASAPGDCTSGHCVDGVCCASSCDGPCQQCNSMGSCTNLSGAPHSGRTCAPYASCVAGACASSCSTDTDCASSSYCVGSSCVAKKSNGVACTATRECASGQCVDGVCCTSACTGQCEACDLPTSLGTCAAVTGLPRGGRAACGGSGECGQVCNGVTRASCVYLPAGSTPCGTNACSAGVETHASTCNGMGACGDTPKSCGAYVCGSVTCKTGCGGRADCAAGFICALGACVPAPGLGEACKSGSECSTGFCVDGVCCGVASCGAGSTCASKAAPGQCRKLLGVACATNDECDTAQCVDGVCCDAACTGQCEACNVPGSAGKCVAAKGSPRGGRAACSTDTASPCASKTCDGIDRASCVGFAPKETACRAPSCKDGVATTAATCDGAGGCPAPTTLACGAYACDAEGRACRTRCDDASHCAPGNSCLDGACVPSAATCSSDGLARFAADGTVTSCAPFLCKGGECATACGTTSDCAPGLVCAETRCIAPPSSDDGGGCTVSRTSSWRGAWLVLAAAVLSLARRRRRLAVAAAVTALGCSPGRAEEHASIASTTQPIALSVGAETIYRHADAWAVPLTGGDVLLGGGFTSSSRFERFVASTGKWIEAERVYGGSDSAAVAIPGNKVLVAGAMGYSTPRPAEVYDVATNTAAATASPSSEHRYPTLSWLPSVGKALIAGGATNSAVVSAAELWTPSSGTWAPTGALEVARAAAASVQLSTGRVLAIGGTSTLGTTTALSSVESYDPASGTWTLVASMSMPRNNPNAVVLTDGRVLVAGGNTGAGALSTAEIYSPSTNTWTTVAPPLQARTGAVAARLPSGRVLLAGGLTSDSSVEVYDPSTNTWLPAGTMSTVRVSLTAAALSDGRVLLVGGNTPYYSTWTVDVFTEQPNGATCTGGGECTSGFCVDGRCCNTACNGACQACDVTASLGTCTAISGPPRAGHPTCSPYASCAAGVCASTCASDTDCASTAWCSGTSCVAKKANGASCAGAKECASGACADGVCCSTACDGQCEACAETGKVGTCSPIAGLPRGTRPACTGIAVGGQCGIQCDGVERKGCLYPPATKTCSAAACSGGVETHASTCNGVGLCNDVPKTCGAFACGAASCKTTCAATADCAAGFVCKSAACVPAPGLGMPCSSSAPCEGGLSCTDGVCCGESTCGAGKSCALPAATGRCAKIDGQPCATDGECGSGTCVDGVCCESRCAGQCQACDVTGNEGKCVAVKGAPHGARPECAKGSTACEASSCDGTDGSRCAALADTAVMCREPSCSDDVAMLAASCDGKGTCAAPVTVACAPYRCAGAACSTSCTKSDECTKGNDCVDGKCVKSVAQCSSDGVAVIDPEKRRASCLPYKCRDAACLTSCKTSDDCAPGTVCDGSGVCTTAPAPGAAEEGDGGCALTPRPRRSTWLVIAAIGLAMLVRRRRGQRE